MTMHVTSPDSPELVALGQSLAALAPTLEAPGAWPEKQLGLCAKAGVFSWFVPQTYGGQEWTNVDLVRGYLALSRACLTTTFVLTQWAGGCRRVAISPNENLKRELLPQLAAGEHFITIAISHLTTSRRHLSQPVMRAEEAAGGYVLSGYSPWVTGAPYADSTVLGAVLPDERQLLLALPRNTKGVSTPEPPALVSLNASQTGELRCENAFVSAERVVHGPARNVMTMGVGAGTGGLQTSTLALGLTQAALAFLAGEADRRQDLKAASENLRNEAESLEADLFALADGEDRCTADDLRARANSLVLRATQAALVAAKGAGFVASHPAGRWCREALFFLVWSCPQAVLSAHLCELAGIEVE